MKQRKIKFITAYDGTDYSGFQRQEKVPTIQGELETQLSRVLGEAIVVYASGRTDKGVHAMGQVCHFYTQSIVPTDKLAYILSSRLPRGILVHSFSEVTGDFDARKSACWKTYHYVIDNRRIPDLYTRRFRNHLREWLDVARMNEAAQYLLGTHDFTSFCSTKTHVVNRVRTVYRCEVTEVAGVVTVAVTGSGFLYNMVRIIVGTLIKVGLHRKNPQDILDILSAKDRSLAGPTWGPEGLCLMEVGYQEWRVNS